MFDTKDILARLQNGENIQDIADEVTKIINEANAAYEAEKAAAEVAEVQKEKELQEIIYDFIGWYMNHYETTDDEIKRFEKEFTAAKVIDLMDAVKDFSISVKRFDDMLGAGANSHPCEKTWSKCKTSDSIINDFLKDMGW